MLWCLSLWMGVGWYCGWDFWMSSVEFSIHQLWSACRRGLSVGFSRKVRWDCCFACAVVCMLFAVVITTHLKFIAHDILWHVVGGKIIFQSIAIFYFKMWTNILTNIIFFLDIHYLSNVWGCHQVCIYLIKNPVETVILWNIISI